MKIRVIGVKHYPQKNCFAAVLVGDNIKSDKFVSYGIRPVDKFCRNMSLFDTFIECIGKDVNIEFDFNGNISAVTL